MNHERVPGDLNLVSEGAVMVAAMPTAQRKELDTGKQSSTACQLERTLREKIVGQEEAVQAIVDLYQVFCAGLHCPGRPVGNLRAHRFRQNAHCGGRCRDSIRRLPSSDQGGQSTSRFRGSAGIHQGGMGFIQPNDQPRAGLQKKVERAAVEAARRRFSPEFMNRLDKLVVFHPLKREELDEVLEIELHNVQKRVLDSAARPFLFRITEEGREFLLQEGTDQRYGARHLKRAIERYVVCPMARLLATAQVRQGDMLLIDLQPGDKGLAFSRDTERRSLDPRVALAARNSGQLTTVEAHA